MLIFAQEIEPTKQLFDLLAVTWVVSKLGTVYRLAIKSVKFDFQTQSSMAHNLWFKKKILNSESHDLGLLSLYNFWGKCVYFLIFEW